MKKVIAYLLVLGAYLIYPIQSVWADTVEEVFGKITPPPAVSQWGTGAEGISKFLNQAIILIYIVAGVIFVFMLLMGGLQWIMSGGDKEAINKARGRIVHAIIGIVLLSLVWLILKVLGQILGFTFFASTGI